MNAFKVVDVAGVEYIINPATLCYCHLTGSSSITLWFAGLPTPLWITLPTEAAAKAELNRILVAVYER